MASRARKPKAPEGRKVMQVLPVTLGAEERLDRSKEADEIWQQVEGLEAELKELTKKFKQLISERTARARALARQAGQGTEEQEVEAIEILDVPARQVHYWHDGKIALSREMTEDDQQDPLPLPPAQEVVADPVEAGV